MQQYGPIPPVLLLYECRKIELLGQSSSPLSLGFLIHLPSTKYYQITEINLLLVLSLSFRPIQRTIDCVANKSAKIWLSSTASLVEWPPKYYSLQTTTASLVLQPLENYGLISNLTS